MTKVHVNAVNAFVTTVGLEKTVVVQTKLINVRKIAITMELVDVINVIV